ncbi:MAG: sigma-70 family RNA polymerase sigma factor [Myxococcota bacterium]
MSSDHRPDAELLRIWAEGDKAAGGELLRRHFELLYRFFATKIDDKVDDLVQRTLLAAVERRDHIQDPDKFRAYLLGIARYQLIGYIRSKSSGREDVLDASVADAAASPPSLVLARQEQRLLMRALRSLPLRLQIAVGLYYFDGMKVADIADITEAPVGTVKDRLARARTLLREAAETLASSPQLAASTVGGVETWLRSIALPQR